LIWLQTLKQNGACMAQCAATHAAVIMIITMMVSKSSDNVYLMLGTMPEKAVHHSCFVIRSRIT
jgi:hypothetical protein